MRAAFPRPRGNNPLGARSKEQIPERAGVSIIRAGTGVPCPYNGRSGGVARAGLLLVTADVLHAERKRRKREPNPRCPIRFDMETGRIIGLF